MKTRHKITGVAVAASLAAAGLAAAEPNRTTALQPGGPGFAWDGGPISGGAYEPTVGGEVPCGPGKECDDTLITAPRGQLDIEIKSDDPSPTDIDLYLFRADENGEPKYLVKSSTTEFNDERVTAEVAGGHYLARVVAALANGATFKGTAVEGELPPLDSGSNAPDLGPDPAPADPVDGGAGGDAGGGQTTVPAATNLAPVSSVKRPGRRARKLVGSAVDRDGKVQYVDVALVRLRADDRCRALTPRGTWRRIRKCDAPPFVRAKGRESWKVGMKRRLRPGRYALYSRATDNVGKPESGFGRGNLVTFRVR